MRDIVFFVKSLSGQGGTESVLTTVLNELSLQDNVGIVIGNVFKDDGWVYNFKPSIRLSYKKNIKKIWLFSFLLNAFVGSNNADIVVCLDAFSIRVAKIIRKVSGRNFKIVSWVHFELGKGITQNIDSALKLADAHLSISSGNSRYLNSIGVRHANVYLVFNPSSLTDSRTNFVTRNTDEILRLIYIGRHELDGYKNLRFLFDALSRYDRKFIIHMFGFNPHTDETVKLYCESILPEGSFVFHKWSKNPWADVTKSDALVLTSISEGFSLAVLEALNRGLPVISSRCGGPEDMIIPGLNGNLFEIDNYASFKESLDSITSMRDVGSAEISRSVEKFRDTEYFENLKRSLDEIIRS